MGSGNAADGIYLVTELEDDRGVSPAVAKPADPFFVQVPQTDRDDLGSLIYDVVVQPIADIPVSAGDEIYADYYTIRDTLNEKILLDGLTVNTKTDSSDWVALEFGTDYTVLD